MLVTTQTNASSITLVLLVLGRRAGASSSGPRRTSKTGRATRISCMTIAMIGYSH